MPWSRSCCGADTSNATPAPVLPRTGCTDLLIRVYPRLTRQIAPLRYGRVSRGRTAPPLVAESIRDKRIMQNNQTIQDAKRLLAAMSTNHSEARMASPYGLDRPFSPNWADAEQAGLDRVRRDAAMGWLIDNDLLEREEEAEAENLRGQGEGLPDSDYVYGSVFRITDSGRELL